MRKRREITLLLGPFLANALTCEAYFATVSGRPCGSGHSIGWSVVRRGPPEAREGDLGAGSQDDRAIEQTIPKII
jgi:hypothetical protein